MHPLSLQLAVALLPPSRSHRVGMEGRHSVDQAHVEVRPAELRSARLRSAELRVPQLATTTEFYPLELWATLTFSFLCDFL